MPRTRNNLCSLGRRTSATGGFSFFRLSWIFASLLLLCYHGDYTITFCSAFVGVPRTISPATRRAGRIPVLSLSTRIPSPSSGHATPSPQRQVLSMETSTKLLLSSTTAGSINLDYEDKTNNEQQRRKYNWSRENMALVIPAMFGMLGEPLLSMVDTAFVGRVGPLELAALGACTSIFNMAFTVFRASTMATTSLVGSAPTEEEGRRVTQISLRLALVMGTCLIAGLRFGGKGLLSLMGIDSGSLLLGPACEYLFTRCWAAPAALITLVAEGAFRGKGDTRTPLLACGVAAVINLILDPVLMFPLGLGVMGAAAATALSQVGAVAVHLWFLIRRQMLPQHQRQLVLESSDINDGDVALIQNTEEEAEEVSKTPVMKVLRTIISANLSMLAKQGSIMFFYMYAAALATRMGHAHVAAHQVALSFWLVFTIWLDSASVSGQVLMSRAVAEQDEEKAWSLAKYMTKFGLLTGLASTVGIWLLRNVIPVVFTKDPTIRSYLSQLMPHMAIQQVLISLLLIYESMAIGGNQFKFMAVGTTICTVLAILQMQSATHVVTIWSRGFLVLFGTRMINATIGLVRVLRSLRRQKMTVQNNIEYA